MKNHLVCNRPANETMSKHHRRISPRSPRYMRRCQHTLIPLLYHGGILSALLFMQSSSGPQNRRSLPPRHPRHTLSSTSIACFRSLCLSLVDRGLPTSTRGKHQAFEKSKLRKSQSLSNDEVAVRVTHAQIKLI